MPTRLETWEYNPKSIIEAFKLKQDLCKKDNLKCDPTTKCKHFYEVYHKLWKDFLDKKSPVD